MRKALKALEEIGGIEDLQTLSYMVSLGTVLIERKKYKEAEAKLQKALKVRERLLGPEHPNTLTSVSHLAFLFDCQKKYSTASEFYRRAYDGYSRVLGLHHPETVLTYKNYNGMLKEIEGQRLQSNRGRRK